jgi:hypothetical protein
VRDHRSEAIRRSCERVAEITESAEIPSMQRTVEKMHESKQGRHGIWSI